MNKNYYEVLEVDKSSTIDEIKKSYKKLSMQHHPDRNQGSKESEEKFKELAEAYSILSDPEKRSNYDRYGTSESRGGFNMDDIFSQFGDIFGGFGNFGKRRKRGSDIQLNVSLSLVEVILGISKKVSYKRNISCSSCNGKGGTDISSCHTCSGSGHRVIVQQTPFGRIQQTIQCDVCHGDGNIPKSKCGSCNGGGVTIKEEIIDINIPSGAIDGMQLVMEGNGNHIKNGTPGDLFLIIKEIPDDKFKRKDIDLHCEEWISIPDAVFGTSINVDTPHGVINLIIPNGSESGKIFKVKGKGIPNLAFNGRGYVSNGTGDLNVKVSVRIPKILSNEQRDIFNNLKSVI